MPVEIERKFLISQKPEGLSDYPSDEIIQGYIDISDTEKKNVEMRIRKMDNKYFQTIKSGFGLERSEEEIQLSRQQFNTLWPLTEGKRIEKIRYKIKYGKYLIELDIYSGSLDGLVVAEVEFDSVEESEDFDPPGWFGKEVTDDERYKARNLATLGMPKT